MPACAILALIAGPNSTQLCLVQFMPVTRAINAKIALAAMLLIILKAQVLTLPCR